jgi:hypothetical protein
MGTVLKFPVERCRVSSGAIASGERRARNVVILPAIRIERHAPDWTAPVATPAQLDKTPQGGRRRRRR